MTRALHHGLLPAVAFAVACDGNCGLDLERMIEQPRYEVYEPCEVCPDGTLMMRPPEGTVSRTALIASSALAHGRDGTAFVQEIPFVVDRRVLTRGKRQFDIFCAACHGRLGNGLTQVAENMTLRPPPNLLGEPYTSYPPGRIYAVIAEGYGLMRSYAPQLTVEERWAVVAYLQALQLSQHVVLGELPDHLQQEATRWLK